MRIDINSYDGYSILLGALSILAEIDIKSGRPILALNAVDKTNYPNIQLIDFIRFNIGITKDAIGHSIDNYYPLNMNFYQYWKNREPTFV